MSREQSWDDTLNTDQNSCVYIEISLVIQVKNVVCWVALSTDRHWSNEKNSDSERPFISTEGLLHTGSWGQVPVPQKLN